MLRIFSALYFFNGIRKTLVKVINVVTFLLSLVCQNDGLPALVTLKKGLVALARQWMMFIVVTQAFKGVGLLQPNQLPKPKEPVESDPDPAQGVDSGGAIQSDTSADGAEFEYDAGNEELIHIQEVRM